MGIVGSDGHPRLNTYCIDCGEVVVTAADEADSYFEWLMAMPKSKRSEASPSNPSLSFQALGVEAFMT
jgi:hypothetical protein